MEQAPIRESSEQVSDTRNDLVARYRASSNDKRLGDEILEAFGREIHQAAKRAGSVACPRTCGRDEFCQATLNRTQLKFVMGIRTLDGPPKNWSAWISVIAGSAALEELDFYAHRRWNIPVKEFNPENTAPQQAAESTAAWDVVFLSSYHQGAMAQPPPPTDHAATAAERKALLLKLLALHAQASRDSWDSARSIRLKDLEGWNVTRIAAERFGIPLTPGKERAVRRELADDYRELQALLKSAFHITSLADL